MYINTSMPIGRYMREHFNFQKSYFVPTRYFCVFCVDLKTNSDSFPMQQYLAGFIT